MPIMLHHESYEHNSHFSASVVLLSFDPNKYKSIHVKLIKGSPKNVIVQSKTQQLIHLMVKIYTWQYLSSTGHHTSRH